MSDYPEHDKLAAVQRKSQAIGEFLDWLNEQGILMAKYGLDADDPDTLYPTHEGITPVLARYFDIDLNLIETEKQAMLASIRQEPVKA
jgi:hypothetical protein